MKRGFNLIELMVVITIMGTLFAIAGYTWGSVSARGRDNTRRADLARIKGSLMQYYLDYRQYPVFDVKTITPRIYSAGWQLADSAGLACPHSTTDERLTRRIFRDVPRDPTDKRDYANSSCDDLAKNQASQYLYLSGPTDKSQTNPILSPVAHFALLATLEKPTTDEQLPDGLNPFVTPTTNFGNWYSEIDNYNIGGIIRLNANYMITDSEL